MQSRRLLPMALLYRMMDVVHVWENSELVRHVGPVGLLGHQYNMLLVTLLRKSRDEKRQWMPCAITAALVGLATLLWHAFVLAFDWERFGASSPPLFPIITTLYDSIYM